MNLLKVIQKGNKVPDAFGFYVIEYLHGNIMYSIYKVKSDTSTINWVFAIWIEGKIYTSIRHYDIPEFYHSLIYLK